MVGRKSAQVMKPRLLFVDDEPRVLQALRHHLRCRFGEWEMEFFSAPSEALERHKCAPFNIVVTDLRMPDLDGFALVRALREVSPDIVPIILTGTGDLAAAVKAINESAVFRFYTKPTPAQELFRGIAAALQGLGASATAGPGQAASHDAGASIIETEVSVFDHLRIGAIVVDRQAKVIFANRTGADLLAAGDGLAMAADGACHAPTSEETEKLHGLIRQTLDSGRPAAGRTDSVLPLGRRSSPRPLAVVAFLYGRDGTGDPGEERLAVLLVHDPDNIEGPTEADISNLLGLSASEARLAKRLADGEPLEDASHALGLTFESGRTYLKRIFQKTGAKRQADLVRMILTSTLSR